MRKRSGGIHSQSEEQYIKLAQLAQNKLGLFYDQKPSTNSIKALHPKDSIKNTTKTNFYADFDYNQQKVEYDQQQKESNAKNEQQTLHKAVIIAENTCEIKTAIKGYVKQHPWYECQYKKENQSEASYNLDLLVIRTKKYSIKVWIMSFRFFQCAFSKSYIKGVSNVYALIKSSQNSNNQNLNTITQISNLKIIEMESDSMQKLLQNIMEK